MKIFSSIFLTSYFILFAFSGCGYKPSSYYAKNAIKGDVYVDMEINIDNAQNSVLIKDAMNEVVLNQFKANLTSNKKDADTLVTVNLASLSNTAVISDDEGYIKTYRATVNIDVSYQAKGKSKVSLKVTNYYDYSVDFDSVVTEQKKQEAIKIAATKALSDIFSKIAVSTLKG